MATTQKPTITPTTPITSGSKATLKNALRRIFDSHRGLKRAAVREQPEALPAKLQVQTDANVDSLFAHHGHAGGVHDGSVTLRLPLHQVPARFVIFRLDPDNTCTGKDLGYETSDRLKAMPYLEKSHRFAEDVAIGEQHGPKPRKVPKYLRDLLMGAVRFAR